MKYQICFCILMLLESVLCAVVPIPKEVASEVFEESSRVENSEPVGVVEKIDSNVMSVVEKAVETLPISKGIEIKDKLENNNKQQSIYAFVSYRDAKNESKVVPVVLVRQSPSNSWDIVAFITSGLSSFLPVTSPVNDETKPPSASAPASTANPLESLFALFAPAFEAFQGFQSGIQSNFQSTLQSFGAQLGLTPQTNSLNSAVLADVIEEIKPIVDNKVSIESKPSSTMSVEEIIIPTTQAAPTSISTMKVPEDIVKAAENTIIVTSIETTTMKMSSMVQSEDVLSTTIVNEI